MSGSLFQQETLDIIVSEGIETVLVNAGFKRARKFTWTRDTNELVHVVALSKRRDTYGVQWGIVSEEATRFLWGQSPKRIDVGDSVMSGTPASIRHPAPFQTFQLESINDPERIQTLVSSISADMHVVEVRMACFQTRHELKSYLLENRNAKDRRDFVIPANLPLKLYTAAVLAVIDQDSDAVNLVEEADAGLSKFRDRINRERIARLRAALDNVNKSSTNRP